LKVGERRRDRFSIDDHILDARAGGAAAQRHLETEQALGVALGHDLHRTVGMVPHPAGQPLADRGLVREESEPDSLDPSADHVALRLEHREGRL
jgi:hypothetical protein